MILDKYMMKTEVTSNDVGPSRTLKPSSLMKFIQEVAGVHLRESGLSYETMKEKGIVYLIVKIAVKINRHLNCGEKICVETWFEKLEGVKFVRNVRFYDMSGETVIEAKSLWVGANPETHRIIRPKDFPLEIPESTERTVDVDFIKTHAIENGESYKREVMWSDIDYNYHMNNSIYASIFCDYFPEGLLDKKINFFQIDFEGEAKLEDIIDIKTEKCGDHEAYFEGTIDGKRCFRSYVKLGEM